METPNTAEKQEAIESFARTLRETAESIDMFRVMGEADIHFPLTQIAGFENLEGDEDAVFQALQRIGCNVTAPAQRTYTTEGTPGTDGEGQIHVDVFRTDIGSVVIQRRDGRDWVLTHKDFNL